MNTVKNVIILAAGLGNRLGELTIHTPKPLIKVFNKPMIEYTLDRIHELKVENIFIVTGYLSHKFEYLKTKYKNVQLVFNPDFYNSNNISSIFYVKEFLSESLIIEGDLVISNSSLLQKTFSFSHYKGIKVAESSDWCFELNDKHCIKSFRKGGKDCIQMVGISYWDLDSGLKLKKQIQQFYKVELNNQVYWDEVPLLHFKNDYCIGIETCNACDVYEIDNMNDLVKLDKSYLLT